MSSSKTAKGTLVEAPLEQFYLEERYQVFLGDVPQVLNLNIIYVTKHERCHIRSKINKQ